MDHYRIITKLSLIWWLLSFPSFFSAEKLSPNQRAPLFARGSGGLSLKPPLENDQPIKPMDTLAFRNMDDVIREEMAALKLVNGQLVRVVEGSFSYRSPEGLPFALRYVADEKGYRASFSLGTAVTKKNTYLPPKSNTYLPPKNIYLPPKSKIYLPPKSNTYLPPDRSYLPAQ